MFLQALWLIGRPTGTWNLDLKSHTKDMVLQGINLPSPQDPTCPNININILSNLEDPQNKNMPRLYTKFSKIWPCDLLYNPTLSMIKLVRDIIKTNILTKFAENFAKTMAPEV